MSIKKQWVAPQREAYVEQDTDGFQVSLIEGGRQIGGAIFPYQCMEDPYGAAVAVARAWVENRDRLKDDRRGTGRRPPRIDHQRFSG